MEGFGPSYDQAVADYLLALRASGRSPTTVRDRRRILARLGGHSGGRLALASSDVAEFLASLKVELNTLAQYASSLRCFFAWCVDQGWIPRSPFVGLPRLTYRPRPVDPIPLADVRRALEMAKPRERAVLVTLVTTGLRASELARLRDADIDWERGTARIYGKGGLMRKVAIVEPAVLRPWLGRLSYGVIKGDMRRMARRGRVPGLCAHRLRHTFAVETLRGQDGRVGIRIDLLQRLLGHRTLTATMTYIHYQAEEEALAEQRRLSLVDRLGDAV